MRGIFTLGGIPSTTFGCFVATSTMFDAPDRDVESVSVPGLNGNLIYDNGRFNNFTGTLNCYIPSNMKVNVDALRAWLLSDSGYQRYEDNLHPDEFRLARFVGPFELENSDRVGASVNLTFDCKPQRFLKSGEIQQAYSNGDSIYNPTLYDAYPLIRAVGNGTLTINGTSMTISNNSTYIDIDCSIQEAFTGTTSQNSNVTQSFPVLSPGENEIAFTGLTELYITPRWWTV